MANSHDFNQPVAWINFCAATNETILAIESDRNYTAPPQREWKRITDEEVDDYWDESVSTGCRASFGMGVDYANRVLLEKNT